MSLGDQQMFAGGDWINSFIFNIQRKISNKFSIKTIEGVNDSIGTAFATIWGGPIGKYPFKDVVGSLTLVSANTADDISGDGAQKVEVDVIGADGLQTTIIVDTNGGTTPVFGSFKAVNRVEVVQVGAGLSGTNVGDISVLYDAGDVLGFLEADRGRAQQAAFTLPLDKEGYVFRVSFTSASGDNGFIEGRVRPPGGAWTSVRPQFVNETVAQLILPYNRIPPGSQLELRAKLASAGGSISVAGDIDILLRKIKF